MMRIKNQNENFYYENECSLRKKKKVEGEFRKTDIDLAFIHFSTYFPTPSLSLRAMMEKGPAFFF
jgi:hypothetical protein